MFASAISRHFCAPGLWSMHAQGSVRGQGEAGGERRAQVFRRGCTGVRLPHFSLSTTAFWLLENDSTSPNFLLPLCKVRAALLGYWDEAETKSAQPRAWRVVSSLHQRELLFSKQGCVYAVATSCFSRERGAHFALDTDSPFPAARLTTAPLIWNPKMENGNIPTQGKLAQTPPA